MTAAQVVTAQSRVLATLSSLREVALLSRILQGRRFVPLLVAWAESLQISRTQLAIQVAQEGLQYVTSNTAEAAAQQAILAQAVKARAAEALAAQMDRAVAEAVVVATTVAPTKVAEWVYSEVGQTAQAAGLAASMARMAAFSTAQLLMAAAEAGIA